jgi:[acyl-carrier-protein] S-malonyltransferase
MVKQNVDTVIECGPGKVLSGLIKRIDRSLNILPIFDPASLDKARAELTA